MKIKITSQRDDDEKTILGDGFWLDAWLYK